MPDGDVLLVATHADKLDDVQCKTRIDNVLQDLTDREEHRRQVLGGCLATYRFMG